MTEKQSAPQAEVVQALDFVDDFIARCNGDDRGSCESVEILRRALSNHAQAEVPKGMGLSLAQEPKYTVDGHSIINRASGEAIPPDEPVFIFRARDKLAVRALLNYADQIGRLPGSGEHFAAVRKRVKHFRAFASRHPERMKTPDTTPTSPTPAEAADPMDWPLPCDVTVGHGTMRKGVKLRTLVTRMKVLYQMATGTDADEVANRTPEQRQALFDASPLGQLAKAASAPTPAEAPAGQGEALRLADAIDPLTREKPIDNLTLSVAAQVLRTIATPLPAQAPIDMILHCPACGKQHIDKPEGQFYPGHTAEESVAANKAYGLWDNPPHRSHLCHGCGHIWRPADVPTNGVATIKTKGKNDSAQVQPAEQVGLTRERIMSVYDPRDGAMQGHEEIAFRFARRVLALASSAQQQPVSAEASEEPSEKQRKLLALADRIDHEQLWRWAGMDHHKMTPEQHNRMNAGVELRRYAQIWKADRWIVIPPVGPVRFSADTLDRAVEMAKRDEARRAAALTPPQAPGGAA